MTVSPGNERAEDAQRVHGLAGGERGHPQGRRDREGQRPVDRGRREPDRQRQDQGQAGHERDARRGVVRSQGNPRSVTVKRARRSRCRSRPGGWSTDKGVKLGVVSLSTFSEGSHDRLRAQVDRALSQGAKGLVLDLRGNGGGLLQEGRLVASIFVPKGLIVSTNGRQARSRSTTRPAARSRRRSRWPCWWTAGRRQRRGDRHRRAAGPRAARPWWARRPSARACSRRSNRSRTAGRSTSWSAAGSTERGEHQREGDPAAGGGAGQPEDAA